MEKRLWTREEEIIVFNLYCKIPFQRSSKSHPDVIKTAKIIGRSPSAVNMKIGNLGSFDETLKKQGIVGLGNASKLDEQIWNEFNGKWDELAFESERLIAERQGVSIDSELIEDLNIPSGKVKEVTIKQRVNQSFFRKAVLTSYGYACCITGLNTVSLLIASHIKPWRSANNSERISSENGILLSPLYDKLFDRGYITFSNDKRVSISNWLSRQVKERIGIKENQFFQFLPINDARANYLEYHRSTVFKG